MKPIRTLSMDQARRLAVVRQRLAGPRLPADAEGIMQNMRDLGCIQLDPINAVARSHLLVLWSRLGTYDPFRLDSLLWESRHLFEYWAYCASIVHTEDRAIHNVLMRRYGADHDARSRRLRKWVEDNDRLIGHVCLRMDRERRRLVVDAVFAERTAPKPRATARAIAGAITALGEFLGAGEIQVGRRVPSAWKKALRSI